MHFTRVDAQVLLLASPFIFSTQSSPADDTGYVYFAGLGAQCEDFEAGFQYSLRNKWWTPYMRFDPSFGTTPSSHGFLLATKRCNTKLLFCANRGFSKSSGFYHLTLAVGAVRLCIHLSCNGQPRFQTVFILQTYPIERYPSDGIAIVARGPITDHPSWNGWGLACKCQILRETNIAQGSFNRTAPVAFGPVDWRNVEIDDKAWTGSVTRSCENWDGFKDKVGMPVCSTTSQHVYVSWKNFSCERDIINPGFSVSSLLNNVPAESPC